MIVLTRPGGHLIAIDVDCIKSFEEALRPIDGDTVVWVNFKEGKSIAVIETLADILSKMKVVREIV